MTALYTVPSTATYRSTDGKDVRYYTAGTLIDTREAVRFGMAGADPDPASAQSNNTDSNAEARTATTDGLGTGQIHTGSDFVTVTCDDANKIVTLPAPTPGTVVRLRNGATGYELRATDPATIAINGGVGANAESAIAANILVTCVCSTATAWVCANATTAGVVSATEVAAP